MLNISAPTNRALKFMKEKPTELKGKIDKCTVIFGDVDISLLVIDCQQKISMYVKELNNTSTNMDTLLYPK